MGVLVIFRDKGHQLVTQIGFRGKVGDPQPLTLQNTKPLFDLVHPRAMNGGMIKVKSGMGREPSLNLFTFMHPEVIPYDMNQRNVRSHLMIDLVQELNEFRLPLAVMTLPIDLATSRIKRRKKI